MTRKDFDMPMTSETFRLETPSMMGYRAGMSSSSMIARKLERLYNLPADTPREIGLLLRELDQKTWRSN